MKIVFLLVVFALILTSVIAVPPPPPAPEGFGGSDDTPPPPSEIPSFDTESVTDSSRSIEEQQSGSLADRVSIIEKKVNELEANSGFLSTPYMFLLAVNIVLIGLVIYMFIVFKQPKDPNVFV
ncbi:hypothetical protein HOL21_04810 [Candidatus Woesearchaeota archaeon]|jgi:hypothetical protein|nr:hypothetical protein [Candidatus Woesearchaeota archaeon]MBT5397507.1 hypothetical protein [Candidatus Woesearchaeota archaeon]MBT6367920.1 hypothetical protein [Candidatus Woesearchaeota archaeon]MBT7763144.1 hypothetical protein [Candidatus Woesearchaeota archaeon]